MNIEMLKLGHEYKKTELPSLLGIAPFYTGSGIIPQSTHDHTPYSGYVLFFVTIDKSKKEAHHQYNDFFDENIFHWDSQSKQTITNQQVQKIIQGELVPLLFVRIKETNPFTYAGKLEFLSSDESRVGPVHMAFNSIDYLPENEALNQIYTMGTIDNFDTISKPVQIANQSPEVNASKTRAKGQRYTLDSAKKKAIEMRAMVMAISHYENLGFKVKDTSLNSPYDLLVTNLNDEEFKVEVKGTTTLGESVFLTKNEVISARRSSRTDLFIVKEISIAKVSNVLYEGSGGKVQCIENWIPLDAHLTATQFSYDVPNTILI